MKSTHLAAGALLSGLAIGFVAGNGGIDRAALAQGAAQSARFQISAWSNPGSAGNKPERGCYILDTVTGELWHKLGTEYDGQPKKAAEKVR